MLDESLTLNDLGVSAFREANAKVGALAEFLEAIRIGRVLRGSILIIESIDRLSRNKVGEALQLFISILNSGVSIAASCKAVNLGEVQSLLGLLALVKGDKLKEVRRKLKSKIRVVVGEIRVHITRVNHMQCIAQVQIHLRNGTQKHLVVQHCSGIRAKARRST